MYAAFPKHLRRLARLLPKGAIDRLKATSAGQRLTLTVKERDAKDRLKFRSGLQWEFLPPCPHALLDAGAAQVGDALYVFGGFRSATDLNRAVLRLDLRTNRWDTPAQAPDTMADSHLAVATDGTRYVYIASGQHGQNCSPPVTTCFSYDTMTKSWRELPGVPHPRYAASMELLGGRLHFVGGAKEDRYTPTDAHLSLAVADGAAQEREWRSDPPIPAPAMHRGSVVLGDAIYMFGGQQGDFIPIPGDPDCRCTRETQETYLPGTFRWTDAAQAWERVADMPLPASHIEFSSVVWEGRIYVLGGQVYKHPESFYLKLTSAVQCYDPATDRWSFYDYLPSAVKTPTAAVHDGFVYSALGQVGRGEQDQTGPFTADTWRAKLIAPPAAPAGLPPMPAFRDRDVLILSHRINYSGAPLIVAEIAAAMMHNGARVKVVSTADDVLAWHAFSQFRLPVVPLEQAVELALQADLIIANTATGAVINLVNEIVEADPTALDRMAWWVHEIDREKCPEDPGKAMEAAVALFDSGGGRDVWLETGSQFKKTAVMYPAVGESLLAATAQRTHPLPGDPLGGTDATAEHLSREDIRARLGIGADDFLVTTVGTVKEAKGQRQLLRTLAKLNEESDRNLRLLLVGFESDGMRTDFFKSMNESERRVFTPERAFVFQQDINAFYAATDAFVLNTQGDTGRGECFGRVVIEAMAFGVPVLGTAGGGVPEIITDGETGYLYPLGEAGQPILAEKLKGLVQDRETAQRIGAAGRDHVRATFTEPKLLEKINAALGPIVRQT